MGNDEDSKALTNSASPPRKPREKLPTLAEQPNRGALAIAGEKSVSVAQENEAATEIEAAKEQDALETEVSRRRRRPAKSAAKPIPDASSPPRHSALINLVVVMCFLSATIFAFWLFGPLWHLSVLLVVVELVVVPLLIAFIHVGPNVFDASRLLKMYRLGLEQLPLIGKLIKDVEDRE